LMIDEDDNSYVAMALHYGVRLTCQGHSPRIKVILMSGNYVHLCSVGRHLPFFRNMWASTLTVASGSGWISVLQPPHWVHSTPTLGRGRSESKNPAMPVLRFEPWGVPARSQWCWPLNHGGWCHFFNTRIFHNHAEQLSWWKCKICGHNCYVSSFIVWRM
jgi:hypothetical protein